MADKETSADQSASDGVGQPVDEAPEASDEHSRQATESQPESEPAEASDESEPTEASSESEPADGSATSPQRRESEPAAQAEARQGEPSSEGAAINGGRSRRRARTVALSVAAVVAVAAAVAGAVWAIAALVDDDDRYYDMAVASPDGDFRYYGDDGYYGDGGRHPRDGYERGRGGDWYGSRRGFDAERGPKGWGQKWSEGKGRESSPSEKRDDRDDVTGPKDWFSDNDCMEILRLGRGDGAVTLLACNLPRGDVGEESDPLINPRDLLPFLELFDPAVPRSDGAGVRPWFFGEFLSPDRDFWSFEGGGPLLRRAPEQLGRDLGPFGGGGGERLPFVPGPLDRGLWPFGGEGRLFEDGFEVPFGDGSSDVLPGDDEPFEQMMELLEQLGLGDLLEFGSLEDSPADTDEDDADDDTGTDDDDDEDDDDTDDDDEDLAA